MFQRISLMIKVIFLSFFLSFFFFNFRFVLLIISLSSILFFLGAEYLGEFLGNLDYSLVELKLSELGTARKGGISAICSGLKKNPHFIMTLSHLDLSENKFETKTSTLLASWLATPNALTFLNLSHTKCNLETISGILLLFSFCFCS